MERASFIFTVLFMLVGPLKVIPGFMTLTHGRDRRFMREVAIQASLIASFIVLCVAVAGKQMVAQYEISVEALRFAAGLILLLSALQTTFRNSDQAPAEYANRATLQLAMSPVAIPMIVPPAGVAAILVSVIIASGRPELQLMIAVSLAVIMLLNFLIMFYIDRVAGVPGLLLALTVLGATLVFIQAALAIETMLSAFEAL